MDHISTIAPSIAAAFGFTVAITPMSGAPTWEKIAMKMLGLSLGLFFLSILFS